MSFRLAFLTTIFLLATTALQARPDVKITVSADDWGDAEIEDIEKVLQSAAAELTSHISGINEILITVKNDVDGPRTLYKRGADSEFIILLDVKGRYWSKLAYQFSHELSHVLTMNQADRQTPNQWFEEAVGETASLYALRKMARTWQTNPPYRNWKSYSSSLSEYAENYIAEEHRKLPSDQNFIQWFEINQASLRENPYLRDKDELIANQLLNLFENYPEAWDAVIYLNHTTPTSAQTFGNYLANWQRDAPPRHRSFIRQVGALFGYRFNR